MGIFMNFIGVALNITIRQLIKIHPKAYIASWKDIEPAKKIEFKIKKVLNGMMVMN